MRKALWCACVFAGYSLCASVPSTAQEVIHALTGTVSSINSVAKTITVFQDNGSKGVFNDFSNGKTRIAFDKKIADEATAATSFGKQGAYAIIFYFGEMENPTAVAVKPLGPGPFASIEGKVTKFDRGREISVIDSTGAEHGFKIEAQTVAEGEFGVVEGAKFGAQKGDHVRIVSETVDGAPTALFLKDM